MRDSEICPHCGGTVSAPDDDVAALRAAVREMGGTILPGDRVREDVAARLVGRKTRSVRGWRNGLAPDEAPLRFRKDGRGRITYRLEDIANWLAKGGG